MIQKKIKTELNYLSVIVKKDTKKNLVSVLNVILVVKFVMTEFVKNVIKKMDLLKMEQNVNVIQKTS